MLELKREDITIISTSNLARKRRAIERRHPAATCVRELIKRCARITFMIKQYMHLLLVLGLLFFAIFQRSAKALASLGIEPIVGYERAQMLIPHPHTKDRLVYGARATYGVLLISGEAEYLHTTSNEIFPELALSTRDTAEKAKVGVRSTVRMSGIIFGFARLGCQATRNKHEESRSGVNVVTTQPIKYHPYAGAGFRFRLGHNFQFTADVTTGFTDFPDMNKNEYQGVAGFVIVAP